MKNLIIAIFKYFVYENKEVILIDSVKEGEEYGGIQLIMLIYHFYNLFNYSLERKVFWKPFKRIISEEALPSLLENNRKGKNPYVSVWFELEEPLQKFDLYSIKIESKIKMNSSIHYVLNNLLEKHKNRSK